MQGANPCPGKPRDTLKGIRRDAGVAKLPPKHTRALGNG